MRRSALIPITRTRPLDSIANVEVQMKERLGNRRREKYHEVRLQFAGGWSLAIDDSTDRTIASQLASTIRRFLRAGNLTPATVQE
jgi:hypothetical protein